MKLFNNTREIIIHTQKFVQGKTLDFGAGTAKYRGLIKPKTSEYITFDMMAGSNIDVVGDVLKPPFKDGEFDTVISTQVLEHVEKPWVMINQIGRILKPGGICIITAPFIVPYHADPHDFFRYTEMGLTSMFKNENFEIVESGTYGRTFGVLSEMIHFSLFSPYEAFGKKRVSRRIVAWVEKTAKFLDKFVKNKVIYSNVYVVARKK
ncbi:MAG: methyltransferase domain-containing protein [Minisyncoccota bacterium]